MRYFVSFLQHLILHLALTCTFYFWFNAVTLTCPSEGGPLTRAWASPPCWRRSVPSEVNIQEVLPLYPVEPWQQAKQNNMESIILLVLFITIGKCQYVPQIPDLSLAWLVGRSGHCTVSGPSGDGVSGAPSGLDDSAACCSSVRGCSSIQLANTSMVWESRSPATSGRDHREVELSEFKKKRWIMECCIANSCRTSPPDDYASACCLRSGWHICSDDTECVTRVSVWNSKWGKA